MLTALNNALGDDKILQPAFETSFQKWWPDLEQALSRCPTLEGIPPPDRSERALLEEILENTREQLRREEFSQAFAVHSVNTPAETGSSPIGRANTTPNKALIRGEGILKFEIYADSSGQYRWRLVSSNGQTIGSSGESFASKANAIRAAENIRDNASKATVVEV
jgi:uncharacterized protein YegP (UPF0339 family)